ncbi:MAG: hypothetical protein ABIQ88_02095 [Chitinophagaceae bacterium]
MNNPDIGTVMRKAILTIPAILRENKSYTWRWPVPGTFRNWQLKACRQAVARPNILINENTCFFSSFLQAILQ